MSMKALIVFVLIAFFPSPVLAEFYKYEDSSGRTHYVNTYEKIPEQYRSQVEAPKGHVPKQSSKKALHKTKRKRNEKVVLPDAVKGMLAWFKADVLKVPIGSKLGTWTDSSKNSFNAVQSDRDNQPIFVLNAQNQSVVRFDGVDDFLMGNSVANALQRSNAISVLYVVSVSRVPRRVSYVWSFHGNTWGQNVGRGGVTEKFAPLLVLSPEPGMPKRMVKQELRGKARSIKRKQLHVYSTILSPNFAALYLQGKRSIFKKRALSIPLRNADYFSLGQEWDLPGPSDFLEGDIAELIIYSRRLKNGERQGLENYLAKKYRISMEGEELN